jgi:hypothetical protein|nr:MAG TPA: hypothetical protein [Caudoviricetes sp.]
MSIDYSTLSPEDMLALNASDYYPDLGTISALDNGLLQFDSNVGFPPPESPSMVGRILAAVAEPGNRLGSRGVSGLHQLGSALYNAATGSSFSDIISRINEIDAQRQAEDQRRWDYIMGRPGASLSPIEHGFNVAGVIIPGASAAKSLIRGAARNALASSAARNAMRAGQAAQTISQASRTIDEMLPWTRGTNFTNRDAMRFLQAAENPNGVRSALADISRNDNLLRSSITRSNSVDDTVDIFTRAGRLDPDTFTKLDRMKSGADITGDISLARQPALRANLGSEINSAARNSIVNAEAMARAAGENLPRAWRNMATSELVDIARDNAIREAWLNRLARQDIRNILPNFGRSYAGFGLTGGLGNALGNAMSDLPYDVEAEARLAEVALSEPTSLKPTGTDTTVPATTTNGNSTNNVDTIDNDTMMVASRAGAPNLYASEPTSVVSDGLSYNDDGTIPVQPMFAEFQKRLQQNAEETKKYREELKKDYENLRNMYAMDPYQWQTRVLLERQLFDAETRAANNYRDDPWNKVGAVITAPLTARRLENPFEVWERSVQAAVDRDPEVRRLRRLLGYTNDLPSGSDRAKSEQNVIEQVSKVNFDLLNSSLKEYQAMLEAATAFNSNVSEERKKKAEARLIQARAKREEEETKYVEQLSKAKIKSDEARANFYNNGGSRGFDPAAISSLLNQGAIGASPLVGNN